MEREIITLAEHAAPKLLTVDPARRRVSINGSRTIRFPHTLENPWRVFNYLAAEAGAPITEEDLTRVIKKKPSSRLTPEQEVQRSILVIRILSSPFRMNPHDILRSNASEIVIKYVTVPTPDQHTTMRGYVLKNPTQT